MTEDYVPCLDNPILASYRKALQEGVTTLVDPYGREYDLQGLVEQLEQPCPICQMLSDG